MLARVQRTAQQFVTDVGTQNPRYVPRGIVALGHYGLRERGIVAMTKIGLNRAITAERLIDAEQRRMRTLDNPGFCVACGHEQGDCEPDARKYKCEECGARQVYGSSELLMMFM